jgi:hypothetical protein
MWQFLIYFARHTYDCVETVYELPLLPPINTANETFLFKSGAVGSGEWIYIYIYIYIDYVYISLGRRPGGERANTWHWTKRFAIFFFEQTGVKTPHLLPHFLPFRIPRRGIY